MFQLYFLHRILSDISSYIFTRLFHAIDMVWGIYMGNFSLKCGKKSFKSTFEELINNATQLARCGFQAPLSHSKHNYKTPDCFLERKIRWNVFGDCEINTFNYQGAEISVILMWNLRVRLFYLINSSSWTKSLRPSCVNKWGSNEEQLTSIVILLLAQKYRVRIYVAVLGTSAPNIRRTLKFCIYRLQTRVASAGGSVWL